MHFTGPDFGFTNGVEYYTFQFFNRTDNMNPFITSSKSKFGQTNPSLLVPISLLLPARYAKWA